MSSLTDAPGEALLANAVAERAGVRPDLKTRLYAALYERWCREVQVTVRVGELLSEGATPIDVRKMLGLTGPQVDAAMAEIACVVNRLRSDDD